MANYYADTSVLVKRHIKEIGAAWVKGLMNPQANNTFFTAQISEVELYSALNRRLREKAISSLRYARLKIVFQSLWSLHYVIIAFTDPVLVAAKDLLEHHPLRAYDAVQLASAIILRRQMQAVNAPAPIFLSADDRLLVAAQAEGFATDNPNLHP